MQSTTAMQSLRCRRCRAFAANLLRYHHYTITQAAQEVGIPDVPYFTRLFKCTMGETPSQYARKKAIES
ncbi:helix-turn-helix domain-containing protein [Gemmiger sp.]|uniref:helix-turn-helix domain-containing protein n=1 Tax=Gemmiger sp. TaxID=2049027 RepID=UPI003AB794B7